MKKGKDIGRVLAVSFFAVVFLMSLAGQAKADQLVFGLDTEFSGGTEPAGSTTPWVTATFDDNADLIGANGVRLTMSANNLVDYETINSWLFNFDPGLNASFLTFTAVDTSALSGWTEDIDTGTDAFAADGDGLYDIIFNLPPPPGDMEARFTTGETVVYDISYTSAITASSFDFFSTPQGGQGTFQSAAHIISINANGEMEMGESGWVGVVPEPVSSTLFLVGAATLGFRRFRKSRK